MTYLCPCAQAQGTSCSPSFASTINTPSTILKDAFRNQELIQGRLRQTVRREPLPPIQLFTTYYPQRKNTNGFTARLPPIPPQQCEGACPSNRIIVRVPQTTLSTKRWSLGRGGVDTCCSAVAAKQGISFSLSQQLPVLSTLSASGAIQVESYELEVLAIFSTHVPSGTYCCVSCCNIMLQSHSASPQSFCSRTMELVEICFYSLSSAPFLSRIIHGTRYWVFVISDKNKRGVMECFSLSFD